MARYDIDYKEYSKMRDIAHKRIMRMQQAGYDVNIQLPTVKQVRASENPYWFMQELRKFVGGKTTLGDVRASGKKTVAREYQPRWPTIPQLKKETEIEKQIRKKASARKTRQHRAIKDVAPEGKFGKWKGYLKSAKTIAERWLQVGKNTGDITFLQNANWVLNMTPTQAKAFTAYVEYRFSQGDFNFTASESGLIEFTQDFVEMANKGKSLTNLQRDFDVFLADQGILREHEKETNKYGLTSAELSDLWKKFVER